MKLKTKNEDVFLRFILLIIFISFSNQLLAQLSDKDFDELLKSKDLVILSEDTKISFDGKKAYYIDVLVEKEIEYKVLKKTANDKIKPIVLPEPFDEVYQVHNSTVRNEHRLFDQVFISQFDIRILQADGTIEELEYQHRSDEHLVVTNEDRFGSLYSHSYSFRDFEPGEIIRIKYAYSFPFRDNWKKLLSTRIFLETGIPRKKYSLTLIRSVNLSMDMYAANGPKPEELLNDNRYTYSWNDTNQAGCIGEPGARAHTNVPWFSFAPKPSEFHYQQFNYLTQKVVPL